RTMKLDIGVTLDFGVAVHPEDGDHKETLIALADKRLYDLKHSGRAAARTVPGVEPQPAREAAAAAAAAPEPPGRPPQEAAGRQAAAPAAGAGAATERQAKRAEREAGAREQRKWERVSLTGTKAYAVLSDDGQKTAKVIDLSYGGVGLQVEDAAAVGEQFNAILHVPILPPVRVVLRKAYTQALDSGRFRVGCAFVS